VTIHPIHATTPPVLTTLAANATFSTVERQVANGFGGWIPAGSQTMPKASGLASADVNGDAVADILITHDTVFVTPLQQVAVLLGVPGGSFVPNLYGYPVNAPASPVAGDLDGNGRMDVVTITPMQFWATVLTNTTPLPAGLVNYGTSSAGCLGPHGLAATGPPAVGTPAFEFTATGAPASSVGLLLIGDVAGSGDPLFVGVELHVDVFASTQLFAVDLLADTAGLASAYVDIPSNPFLLGQVFYATGAFAWMPPCPATPPFGLSGTNGLQITIQ
jgi:hypothetical protein